jgi:hypothetical protein
VQAFEDVVRYCGLQRLSVAAPSAKWAVIGCRSVRSSLTCPRLLSRKHWGLEVEACDAYLEHGRLQPKKSCALRACLVEGLEYLFSTTLPAVSGDGHTNVYFVLAKCLVSVSYAAVESDMMAGTQEYFNICNCYAGLLFDLIRGLW